MKSRYTSTDVRSPNHGKLYFLCSAYGADSVEVPCTIPVTMALHDLSLMTILHCVCPAIDMRSGETYTFDDNGRVPYVLAATVVCLRQQQNQRVATLQASDFATDIHGMPKHAGSVECAASVQKAIVCQWIGLQVYCIAMGKAHVKIWSFKFRPT